MAKADYNLQPNEAVIMKNEHVSRGNESGELVLTNLNLFYITTKGAFKTTYITQQYPLKQIKVINGKPQVRMGENDTIEIYFVNGQESFRFFNRDTFFREKKVQREANDWLNAITQVVAGEDVDISISQKTAISGTEFIAEAVGGTIDAFKGALGFKLNKQPMEAAERVAKKCSFCGAPVSGRKGQTARCSYCDGEQQL